MKKCIPDRYAMKEQKSFFILKMKLINFENNIVM